MPRARNIKPSFFTNDELAENNPLGRLLFIGMWTIADYKGCLEWRPKKIKAQLLPYDDCDIKKLTINLDKSGFIRTYSDGDKIYIKIVSFEEHQNPHKNEKEKGSGIPDYTSGMRQVVDLNTLTINLDKSGLNQEDSHTNPADSCFLIPDSCSLREGQDKPATPKKKISSKFIKPTITELIYSFDGDEREANKFFNHYESNGWRIGKNPMKSWPHAVGNWKARKEDDYEKNKPSGGSQELADANRKELERIKELEREEQEVGAGFHQALGDPPNSVPTPKLYCENGRLIE